MPNHDDGEILPCTFDDEQAAERLDAEAFEVWAMGLESEPEPPTWEPDIDLIQRGGFKDFNDNL